jgi:hypothetical protein
MKGIIYLLTNPAMSGIVKIGKTTQDPFGKIENFVITSRSTRNFNFSRK